MLKLKSFASPFSRPPRSGRSAAQALLEFALALPVLLIIIFGIIDFALLFQAWLSVENITRQTIRYAVTGQYDEAFCTDATLSVLADPSSPYYDPMYDGNGTPCAGASYQAEQDYARILSIHEASQQWMVAIFKDGSAGQSDKGYLHLTICSDHRVDINGTLTPYTFTTPIMASSTYAACALNGTAVENAGEPGDNIFIFVDFNHPLITPFLSQVWPMVHLVSYRQGVVETFRTSRSIANIGSGLGTTVPSTNTFTPLPPTNTFTPIPTNTPTETLAPSPTPTFSCTQFSLTTFTQTTKSGKPSARISIMNGSGQSTNISSLTFTWTSYDGAFPGQTLNKINYSGSNLSFSADSNSPSSWSGSAVLAAGSSPQFQFNFATADPGWPGIVPASSFGLSVVLANGCVLNVNAVPFATLTPSKTATASMTPTASKTPTPSNTPTITRTPTITFTPSKTPTKTPVTPSNTPTKTSIPPTHTPVTPSKTSTPVTPSKTPTKTTIAPTNTPFVPTKTKTPIPPTWTPVTPIG